MMAEAAAVAAVPPPLRCPFDLDVDFIGAMLNFEMTGDPAYSGLEVQAFDDEVHGHGLAVLLTRRSDDRVDCYLQPGLRLDPSRYGIGAGVGRWTETAISPARFDVTPRGVVLHLGLHDADGRRIEVHVDDRGARLRRGAAMLAPFGAGIQHPDSLMLVWMLRFDLVRRTGRAPTIRIDGRTPSIGRLPAAWLHRRLLIKYASDLAVVRLNAGHRTAPGSGVGGGARVEWDASGSGVSSVIAEAGCHRARLELTPPAPSIDGLPRGTTVTGSWRLGIDATREVIGGTFAESRDADAIVLAMDVTDGWRPSHLPPLMRIMTIVAPLFRRWPTTYRWRASVQPAAGATVEGRWLRSGNERGQSYRRLTGS